MEEKALSRAEPQPAGEHGDPRVNHNEPASASITVWVAEQGAYSSRGVIGVYATAEAAMADNPIPADYPYPDVRGAGNLSRRGGWQQDERGCWDNGLDWDAGISVEPYVLKGAVVIKPVPEAEK
jgi:hypothetical protein